MFINIFKYIINIYVGWGNCWKPYANARKICARQFNHRGKQHVVDKKFFLMKNEF